MDTEEYKFSTSIQILNLRFLVKTRIIESVYKNCKKKESNITFVHTPKNIIANKIYKNLHILNIIITSSQPTGQYITGVAFDDT